MGFKMQSWSFDIPKKSQFQIEALIKFSRKGQYTDVFFTWYINKTQIPIFGINNIVKCFILSNSLAPFLSHRMHPYIIY